MPSRRFDEKGWAMMIDVSSRAPTSRSAIASALVRMAPDTLAHVLEGRTAKGDALSVARLAGITAAALTIYDMCKGMDCRVVIGEIALEYKEGGKSGVFRRERT